MELQQLKYFKTVAEMESISDAAQALFISALALSTSVSRLEKELGVKLFDRTNNRIAINLQRQLLLRYANQILSVIDCAKTELRQSIMLHRFTFMTLHRKFTGYLGLSVSITSNSFLCQ